LNRIIEVLLRNGLLLCERRVAIKTELRATLVGLGNDHLGFGLCQLGARLLQLPICLRELALSLAQRSLERSCIDLEKKLALRDERVLFVSLFDQIAGDFRLYVRIDESIESADPFLANGEVALGNRDYPNLERSIGTGGSILS
jgi:hypothetical protein